MHNLDCIRLHNKSRNSQKKLLLSFKCAMNILYRVNSWRFLTACYLVLFFHRSVAPICHLYSKHYCIDFLHILTRVSQGFCLQCFSCRHIENNSFVNFLFDPTAFHKHLSLQSRWSLQQKCNLSEKSINAAHLSYLNQDVLF